DGRAARHRTRHHLFLRVQGTSRFAPSLRESIRAAEPCGAPQHRGREKPAGSETAGEGAEPPGRLAALPRRQGGLQPLHGRAEEVLKRAGARRCEQLTTGAGERETRPAEPQGPPVTYGSGRAPLTDSTLRDSQLRRIILLMSVHT